MNLQLTNRNTNVSLGSRFSFFIYIHIYLLMEHSHFEMYYRSVLHVIVIILIHQTIVITLEL